MKQIVRMVRLLSIHGLFGAVFLAGCGHAPAPLSVVKVPEGVCPSAPPALPYTDDAISGQTPEDVAQLLREGKYPEVQQRLDAADSQADWVAFVRGDLRWVSGDLDGAAQAYREALESAGPEAWVAGVRLVLALDESDVERANLQRRIASVLMSVSTHPGCVHAGGVAAPEGLTLDEPQADGVLLADVLQSAYRLAIHGSLRRAFILDAAAPSVDVGGRRVPQVIREGDFTWPNAERRQEVLEHVFLATVLGQVLESEDLSEEALWMLSDAEAQVGIKKDSVAIAFEAGELVQRLDADSPLGEMLKAADEVIAHRVGLPGETPEGPLEDWDWMEAADKDGQWFLALAPQGVFEPKPMWPQISEVIESGTKFQGAPVLVVSTLERSGICGAPRWTRLSLRSTQSLGRRWPPRGFFDFHASAQGLKDAEKEAEACTESGFLHPRNWFYPYMAGRVSMLLGDFDGALALLKGARGLATHPSAQRAVDIESIEVAGRAKNYDEARALYEAALKNDPEGFNGYFVVYANAVIDHISPAEFVLACRDAALRAPEHAVRYRLSAGQSAAKAGLSGAVEDLSFVIQRGERTEAREALKALSLFSNRQSEHPELAGALQTFSRRFNVSDAEARSVLAADVSWTASVVAEELCGEVLAQKEADEGRFEALKRCAPVFVDNRMHKEATVALREVLGGELSAQERATLRVTLSESLTAQSLHDDVVALWAPLTSSIDASERAQALIHTAWARQSQGKGTDAIKLARRAAKTGANARSWGALGEILIANGKDKEGLKAHEEAIEALTSAAGYREVRDVLSPWMQHCRDGGFWAQCVQKSLQATFATPEIRCAMGDRLLDGTYKQGLLALSEPLLEPQRLCEPPHQLTINKEMDVLLALGRVDDAVAVLEGSKEMPYSVGDLFDALYHKGQRERADKIFERFIEQSPQWDDRRVGLVERWRRFGRFEEAEALALTILKEKPAERRHIELLVNFYAAQGKSAEAMTLFGTLMALAKDDEARIKIQGAKAAFLDHTGRSVEAAAIYKEMLDSLGEEGFDGYAIAASSVFERAGELEAGRRLCHRNKRTKPVDALECEVRLLMNAGRWKEAWGLVKDIDPSLRSHQEEGRLFAKLAMALGRKSDALLWSQAYLSANASSFLAHLEHLQLLTAAGKLAEAKSALDILLKDFPKDAFGLFADDVMAVMGVLGRGEEAKRLYGVRQKDSLRKRFWFNPKLKEREIKARMKRDALDPDAWASLGRLRMRQERYKDAVEAFEQRLSLLTHGKIHARYELAEALWLKGELDQGVKVLRQGLAEGESVEKVHGRMGRLWWRAGQCQEAVEAFRLQRDAEPGAANFYATHAQLSAYVGQDLSGLEDFKGAEATAKSLFEWAVWYNLVLHGLGFDGSQEMLERALAQRPGELLLVAHVAMAFEDAGQPKEALKWTRVLWERERTFEADKVLLERLLAAGHLDEAKALVAQAKAIRGSLPEADMMELRFALHSGQPEASRKWLKAVSAASVKPDLWHSLVGASLAMASGQPGEAASLAALVEESERREAAKFACYPDADLELARVLAFQGGAKAVEAQEILKQWVAAPLNPKSLSLVAEVYLVLGQFDDAMATLDKAQEVRGGPWRELDVLKIEALVAKGDKEGARALLKKAQSRIQGHWRMAVINARLEP